MNFAVFMLSVIFGGMLAELRLSRRNERALRARGAMMPPGDVYGYMSVLYPLAFAVMGAEGIWHAATAPAQTGPSVAALGVVLFIGSKAIKYWAIGSLRERWSFRVWVMPGQRLVREGPYRYISHPNYVGVIGELVATAMMMGAYISGPIMVAAFGVVLVARIRFEERVLRQNYGRADSGK